MVHTWERQLRAISSGGVIKRKYVTDVEKSAAGSTYSPACTPSALQYVHIFRDKTNAWMRRPQTFFLHCTVAAFQLISSCLASLSGRHG